MDIYKEKTVREVHFEDEDLRFNIIVDESSSSYENDDGEESFIDIQSYEFVIAENMIVKLSCGKEVSFFRLDEDLQERIKEFASELTSEDIELLQVVD